MIYQNSRYTKTEVVVDDGVGTFKLRKRFEFSKDNAIVHQFCEGDTLDGLADTYYNDPQLWWVFLEANPSIKTPLDIIYGTNLVVPNKNEVLRCLHY